jgi:hypothetical protein
MSVEYLTLMDATWRLLNSGPASQRKIVDGLSGESRRAMASALWPALEVEMARRRKTVSKVLRECFPVAFFAYAAREGAEGVMRFLESDQWVSRPPQPGSSFPPAVSTSAAFYAFLLSTGWPKRQQQWIREALSFEAAYLFGAPPPEPRLVGGRAARLARGAWVAEAPFDPFHAAQIILQRVQEDPWHDAVFFVKPPPCPFAAISAPAGDKLRRVRLSGPVVPALRWLWDASAEAPAGALDHPAFRRALAAGVAELLPVGS